MIMTRIIVYFNGAGIDYEFACSKDKIIRVWENHIPAVGYFTKEDRHGKIVVINPSNCGAIEIHEFGRSNNDN